MSCCKEKYLFKLRVGRGGGVLVFVLLFLILLSQFFPLKKKKKEYEVYHQLENMVAVPTLTEKQDARGLAARIPRPRDSATWSDLLKGGTKNCPPGRNREMRDEGKGADSGNSCSPRTCGQRFLNC